MKNFIKKLSDGGLAEDTYAFMERALDENDNKGKMVNKDEFIEKGVKYLEANFPDIENVGGWYKENFINNFRKIMEE
jgi:hypothetical protein